jgi:hypothetical protein
MAELFGQRIEPDFDLAKEKRQDRVGWAILVAVAICIAYDAMGRPLALDLFQGGTATILCYGAKLYANRRNDLNKLWLWKAIVTSVPLHVAYLAALFWSDRAAPEAMTKAVVFMPVLAISFVVESILIDQIVGYFKARVENTDAS